MPPLPPIVGGMLPPQRDTFRLGEQTPWVWNLVMGYFDKREIHLEPF